MVIGGYLPGLIGLVESDEGDTAVSQEPASQRSELSTSSELRHAATPSVEGDPLAFRLQGQSPHAINVI